MAGFFDRLQKEGPDFTLNAGDIMDARWWEDAKQVQEKTEEYWVGFKKRFDERGMTVYVAPGASLLNRHPLHFFSGRATRRLEKFV